MSENLIRLSKKASYVLLDVCASCLQASWVGAGVRDFHVGGKDDWKQFDSPPGSFKSRGLGTMSFATLASQELAPLHGDLI